MAVRSRSGIDVCPEHYAFTSYLERVPGANTVRRRWSFNGCSMALLRLVVCGGWLVSVAPVAAQDPSGEGSAGMAFERCSKLTDDQARLRCFESQTNEPLVGDAAHPGQGLEGGWRLLRTPNPRGGRDAVSIVQIADFTRSDLDLAGLMFRCGESAVEALLVVITPFPPTAHPTVTIDVDDKTMHYDAKVVPPGALLLLPPSAAILAAGPWQQAKELAVTIGDGQHVIHGTVPLTGLGAALIVLQSNCPAP
jgi:hypothetical protein